MSPTTALAATMSAATMCLCVIGVAMLWALTEGAQASNVLCAGSVPALCIVTLISGASASVVMKPKGGAA